MKFAFDVAEMSRAIKLKVGAVAVKDKRVICIGYNGTPPNTDNTCEFTDDFGNLITKPTVIHAEDNLIRFAYRNNIDLRGCTLYITHSPCLNCSKLIIEEGFKSVYYSDKYKDLQGAINLYSCGIEIMKIGEN